MFVERYKDKSDGKHLTLSIKFGVLDEFVPPIVSTQ